MRTNSNHTFMEDNSPSRSSLLDDRRDSSAYELLENPNSKTKSGECVLSFLFVRALVLLTLKSSSNDLEQANDLTGFQKPNRHQRECETTFQPTEKFGWFLRPIQEIWWGKNCSGWRMTVALCTLLTVVVLLTNIGITIWASTLRLKDGYRVLIENDCEKSKSWGRWSHLAINFISILLLGASNYTMQCLVAPTRAEVDRAHRKGDWIDIGIPSVRNLWRISRRRVFVWLLLSLSSLPLHLL